MKPHPRYLAAQVERDLKRKMVFVAWRGFLKGLFDGRREGSVFW